MQQVNLEQLAREVVNVLACSGRNTAVCLQLLRLLTLGEPVNRLQLATVLHSSEEEVAIQLRDLSDVEYDQEGRIVGSGLTLLPTPHQFQVNGHAMYTWCALDALSYPVILHCPARVESRCPVTGTPIRLTVTPERIEAFEPDEAVISLVLPEKATCCGDVRGTFCDFGHFFSSPAAASLWQESIHPEARILSLEDAYHLGKLVAQYRYGESF
jgi:alkylmercury lyase